MTRHQKHQRAAELLEQVRRISYPENKASALEQLLSILLELLDPTECPHCAHRAREHD